MARSLVEASLELIARSQAPTGAYIAAPDYDTYAYCWLRDGAFIAASMDAYGRRDSAAAFHGWVARAVERHAAKVEALEQAGEEALSNDAEPLRPLPDRFALHTRFTADGEEGHEAWGDFQLDGYGFWLSSLAGHLATTGADAASFRPAVDLVRRYLELTWRLPCFDCWEEYPTRRHMTTWAAMAGGLRASAALGTRAADTSSAERIRQRLTELTDPEGVLRKFVPGPADVADVVGASAAEHGHGPAVAGHERVGRPLAVDAIDGSALLVLGDFGPFAPEGRIVGATLQAVEEALVVDGGVHRYLEDEYYGGGVWVVLAGALAIVVAVRDEVRAVAILEWIETQADEAGLLPEQVPTRLRTPASETAWIERWGPPARPLLWSHAMYLLGVAALESRAL